MNQTEDGTGWLKNQLVRFLSSSSLCKDGDPTLVLVMGGVAAGKTRFRRQRYSHGYVVLDAGEIFLELSNGEYFAFPSLLEDQMQIIGSELAYRSLSERHHIVTELIGDEREPTEAMIRAVKAIGYKIILQGLTCDIEVVMERNQARGINNISAYFTQRYHMRWLTEAAEHVSRNNSP